MAYYTSNPQKVQAVQWTGQNWSEISKWFKTVSTAAILSTTAVKNTLRLQTEIIDGEISVGDWVICNDNGVVFMANDEAFQERYSYLEEVLDPDGGTAENPLGD